MYPQPMLNVTNEITEAILKKSEVLHLLQKK
jgi:hypothetical protein